MPDSPDSPYYSAGKVYYTFPGLQSNEYIIQPVLQYGDNGGFGGDYWRLASWNCGDENCSYSTPIAAATGDTIHGSVESSDCDANGCTWTITTENLSAQTQTARIWEDDGDYEVAVGGAVEVYDLSSCHHYPAPGIFYENITLKNDSGTTVTPSWTASYQSNPDPSCNFSVSSTSSSVDLYHFADMNATITGAEEAPPEEDCAWQAWAGGGLPPYTYSWWGGLSGSSQSLVGSLTQSSYLYVEIVDARSVADTAQFFVDVDEAYECDF